MSTKWRYCFGFGPQKHKKYICICIHGIYNAHTRIHTLMRARMIQTINIKKQNAEKKTLRNVPMGLCYSNSVSENRFTWSFFLLCYVCLDTHDWILVCCILTNTLNDKGERARAHSFIYSTQTSELTQVVDKTILMSIFCVSSFVCVSMTFHLYVCVRIWFHFVPFIRSFTAPVLSSTDYAVMSSAAFHVYLKFSRFVRRSISLLIFNFIFHKIKQFFADPFSFVPCEYRRMWHRV